MTLELEVPREAKSYIKSYFLNKSLLQTICQYISIMKMSEYQIEAYDVSNDVISVNVFVHNPFHRVSL